MNLNFLHALLLLGCFVPDASAGVLKGWIKDAKGISLPYATVFVQGATTGTTANAQGEYSLTLGPGKYIVSCQFIGARQQDFSFTISGDEVITHNFTLADEGLQMTEVVVKATDEDPAYRIIRKAIAKRAFHLKQVKSFQSGIYLKGVFRTTQTPDKILGKKIDKKDLGVDTNGKGVIYLCEEIADYFAQEPDKEKTIIHSVRESGDANGLGFAQIPSVITFYENNVQIIKQIAPRGFVSPIAENAVSFYAYKLEGDFIEQDRTIYKIKVTPRRKFEPLFEGYIYIVDGDWAIHSLSLITNEKSGIEYLESLRIDQVFLPLREDTWVIKSQVFRPVMSIFGFGFTGHFVTVYNNQKVNEPVPDSVFNTKIISTYDKMANKKDTAYWSAFRPIPLEADEARDYHVKDSIATHPVDPRVEDSLRRKSNRVKPLDILLYGKTLTGAKNKQTFALASLIFFTNYNSVEGLNIAPELRYRRTLDTGKTLNLRLIPRYGFENRHFNAMLGGSYTQQDHSWRGRDWTAGAEGGKYVFQYNPANPVNPLRNTFSTLLYNQNYLKIYERWDAAAYFRRNMGNGLQWNVKLNYQHRLPLANESAYSWVKDDKAPMTENIPAELSRYDFPEHKAFLAHIGIVWKPGMRYIQYPDYKSAVNNTAWPTFSLAYDKGIPEVLGSKVDYDKWRLGIEGEGHFKLLGVLSYNLSAGGFLNDKYASLPDLKHLNGNQFFLAAPYLKSFQLAPYYKFSNTENLYGEAHVEYNLYGLFTNKIPLFRQLKWYFILGTNTFYAGNDNYYSEAFLSVDNIGFKLYRLLRIDFVHSWENNGMNRTGIRIGLRMRGISIGASGQNGQW
jgi:hypothetical protein